MLKSIKANNANQSIVFSESISNLGAERASARDADLLMLGIGAIKPFHRNAVRKD